MIQYFMPHAIVMHFMQLSCNCLIVIFLFMYTERRQAIKCSKQRMLCQFYRETRERAPQMLHFHDITPEQSLFPGTPLELNFYVKLRFSEHAKVSFSIINSLKVPI